MQKTINIDLFKHRWYNIEKTEVARFQFIKQKLMTAMIEAGKRSKIYANCV